MIQTWSTGAAPDVTCSKCGAIYSVKVTRLPVRDSDYFNCETCGELMKKWNDTRVPMFTLKKPGIKPGEH